MFVIYTPEGSNAVNPALLQSALKLDPSQKVNPIERSELEQMHISADDAQKNQAKNSSALKQYQTMQQGKNERVLVVKAFEIMSQPVVVIDKRLLLEDAWALMQEKNIHHLPVLEEGRLVGLCTASCILSRAILSKSGELEEIKEETVEQMMVQQVVTTHRDTDIRKIAMVMSLYRLGSVPILAQTGEVIGMVTLSDIVRRLSVEPPLGIYV